MLNFVPCWCNGKLQSLIWIGLHFWRNAFILSEGSDNHFSSSLPNKHHKLNFHIQLQLLLMWFCSYANGQVKATFGFLSYEFLMNISFLSFSLFCSIFKSPFSEASRISFRFPLIFWNYRFGDFVVTFYRTVNKTSLKNLEDPVSKYDVGQTQQRSLHSLCFQVLEMPALCFFGFWTLRLFPFPVPLSYFLFLGWSWLMLIFKSI